MRINCGDYIACMYYLLIIRSDSYKKWNCYITNSFKLIDSGVMVNFIFVVAKIMWHVCTILIIWYCLKYWLKCCDYKFIINIKFKNEDDMQEGSVHRRERERETYASETVDRREYD